MSQKQRKRPFIGCTQKAEAIEKLARSVKEKVKGYN